MSFAFHIEVAIGVGKPDDAASTGAKPDPLSHVPEQLRQVARWWRQDTLGTPCRSSKRSTGGAAQPRETPPKQTGRMRCAGFRPPFVTAGEWRGRQKTTVRHLKENPATHDWQRGFV
jgi:hypothetical protein